MRKLALAACAAVFLWCANISCAIAAELPRSSPTPTSQEARAPFGWKDFCKQPKHYNDCFVPATGEFEVILTEKTWFELRLVNRAINHSLRPESDLKLYGVVEKWTYPEQGAGDCEDYALAKRRMLIAKGWPREVLLITVVRDKRGEGHAILTVVTNRGDVILDNLTDEVRPWFATGYQFLARQSQRDPDFWVAISTNIDWTASTR